MATLHPMDLMMLTPWHIRRSNRSPSVPNKTAPLLCRVVINTSPTTIFNSISFMPFPRVLVTGIGLVTPLGPTTFTTWHALVAGETAVRNHALHPSLPVQIAATVDRSQLQPIPPLLSPCPDFARFALLAAQEALVDAHLITSPPSEEPIYPLDRSGVSIGVGMAHLKDIVDAGLDLKQGNFRRISPFLVPKILPNTPAGLIALHHNLRGPVLSPSSACAAGAHAVLDGFYAIQRGDVDVMVVGGSESVVDPVAIAGFARARALTTRFNEKPDQSSRPFDKDRDGFVLAEGAGILILESEEHVRKRNGRVYAEVVGVGMTGDAWHITAPPPDGRGALRAMELAIERSKLSRNQVDYINAHATGTPVGDAVERLAIARLLDSTQVGTSSVVSSTKGATGHLLGGAGGVEAGFVALSIAEGCVPPTRNLVAVDEDTMIEELGWGSVRRYVPQRAMKMEIGLALCNSFGFGGTNACIAMAKSNDFAVKTLRRHTQT